MVSLQGPDAGALSVDLMVQEGQTGIERVSYYDDRKLGTDLTVEADWRRRGLYIGPQVKCYDFVVLYATSDAYCFLVFFCIV